MKRLYEPAAYAEHSGRFWETTMPAQDWQVLNTNLNVDVAIIGGGFTGLNAALGLAQSGLNTAVFEAMSPAWGASGRNGGFCCLGGSMLPQKHMRKRFGDAATDDWHKAQIASIHHVQSLLTDHSIDADTHSQGETCVAHSARAWRAMQSEAAEIETHYGLSPTLIPKNDLAQSGLGGPWYGAMTTPLGFALNPQKYHNGLAQLAQGAGVQLFGQSPITALCPSDTGWTLTSGPHTITAKRIVLATNGYSSDDLPDWIGARYLPVQSSIILTRPLSRDEQQAAGWWSSQMVYDSRQLLHYFRLLPDGRFLFGMRGGLRATPAAQAKINRKIRRDFNKMFPAWAHIDITHEWSGLVSLMSDLVPFVGPVPDHPGLFAAMGYHGNGVAMSSYCGHLLAQHMINNQPLPKVLSRPPSRVPLGRYRRYLLAPAYAISELFDL